MLSLALLLTLLAFNTTYANIHVTDDTGQLIQLKKPATRIISLAPNLTEILFGIGAGKQVIGVSSSTDYPLAASKLPTVGTNANLDLEAIVRLKPDLIVAWQGGNPGFQLARLKHLGFPVYLSDPTQLTDVAKTMQRLGKLTGKHKIAKRKAQQFLDQLQYLKQHYANQPKISVFYQVWQQPLFTIGKTSFINQIIQLCGGHNSFPHTIGQAPKVSQSAVLLANPDVIVAGEKTSHWKKRWQAYPALTAVKQHNLFSIPPDLIERLGPRLLQGIQLMCQDFKVARRHITQLR